LWEDSPEELKDAKDDVCPDSIFFALEFKILNSRKIPYRSQNRNHWLHSSSHDAALLPNL
jgi:hypothetical protein